MLRLRQVHKQIAARPGSFRQQTTRYMSRIRTSGIIIIADEVLSSKTIDTNSAWFSRFCFKLGVDLKRVEVIADDVEEITEAVARMSNRYDFVVTSGGIGPTLDDITYSSIARAYSLPLEYHEQTIQKMKAMSTNRKINWELPEDNPEILARKRMALFPTPSKVIYPSKDLWVPIVVVNQNVHVLPGIPRLFTQMLEGYQPALEALIDPANRRHRVLVQTSKPEGSIAPFLDSLQKKVGADVKVGSYPRDIGGGVVISLLGKDLQHMKSFVAEIEKNVDGRQVDPDAERNAEESRGKEFKDALKKS